ncbi:MAG: methyltransferase domain-containing protein [Pseudonocardia sp.]|nr:methyltransferase domain-containing protein [Pseudonocardia sp.]
MTGIGGVAAAGKRAARWAFLRAALRAPGTVGAVTPSSPQLAAVLSAVVPRAGTPTVVELGPGTGAVSAVIERRLPPGSRHLAVELDAEMVGYLQRTRPALEVVQGDARRLGALLAERGVDHADAVICGLPWALFDDATQQVVLAEVSRAIGDCGAFTSFAYAHAMTLSAARQFRRTLRATFDEVLVSATVWRNVPPAFVYVCRRPIVR